ncbi:MAG TPA: FAD/NAD(P)-binding oxidoreductase [Pseudonocardiaceae bacterium]
MDGTAIGAAGGELFPGYVGRRGPAAGVRDPGGVTDVQRMVVVGASLAGLRAVEGARRAGFDGPITLIGAESHLPYDRPPLSKAFLEGGSQGSFQGSSNGSAPDTPPLRTEQALRAELGVDLVLGAPATGLDAAARTVLVGERSYPYTALVIATGSRARSLPGTERVGRVHTLRTVDDARRIRAGLDAGGHVVVVGAGFIGSEVASAARRRGLPVTVVELQATPLMHAVGEVVGRACAGLHLRAGTVLRCGVGVASVSGSGGLSGSGGSGGSGGPGGSGGSGGHGGSDGSGGGAVQRVVLTDGTVLPAGLVVVGTGARPATDWLDGSGLAVDDGVDDGVVCDERLSAGVPGVYAAGDVARWRHPLFGRRLRVEHWTNAAEQGLAAGRNAADPPAATPYAGVPYFWSDWYGHRIQLVGLAATDEVRIVDGDPDGEYLVALYRDGARLGGAITINGPGEVMRYRGLILRGASWRDGLDLAAARRSARLAATA